MLHEIPLTAQDKKWQAESDARTLSEAKIINDDEPRMQSAKVAAEEMAAEERERAEALEDVAGDLDRKVSGLGRRKLNGMFPNTKR